MEGICEAAEASATPLLLLGHENTAGWEKVDGVLISDWNATGVLRKAPPGLPRVSVLASFHDVASVRADDYVGTRDAVRYLMDLGHRRIAYLHGGLDPVSQKRIAGYTGALKSSGVSPESKWLRVLQGQYDIGAAFVAEGRNSMARWLADDWTRLGCTALLCHNDEVAVGAMQVLQENGLRVPGDVSVVGFDGSDMGIESGVDFEKRIAEIYQSCRKHEEIQTAFNQLQLELKFEINEAMTRTRRQLLEHFDDEVTEKLRLRDESSKAILSGFERRLMALTRYELRDCADFRGDARFTLKQSPFPEANGAIPLGEYELPRRGGEAHLYRMGHPLAQGIIERAKSRTLPAAEMTFDLSGYAGNIKVLEPFIGKRGWMTVSQFSVESLGQAEDHLICAATSDDGQMLPEEDACRLFTLGGTVENEVTAPLDTIVLDEITNGRVEQIKRAVAQRNANFFEDEANKIDGWADDLKVGLEREIKELDRQIKEARRGATAALSLEEKLAGQKQVRALESLRSQKRRSLFDAQDDIDRRRESLIDHVESMLKQSSQRRHFSSLRWQIV